MMIDIVEIDTANIDIAEIDIVSLTGSFAGIDNITISDIILFNGLLNKAPFLRITRKEVPAEGCRATYMANRIRITAGKVSVEAELNDSDTANMIWDALPIEKRGSTWGNEIYFSIPVKAEEEAGASEVVEEGDIAYWPPGSAFCIFFGPTPASRGNEVRAASPVNVVGRILDDPAEFKKVRNGAKVIIEKAE